MNINDIFDKIFVIHLKENKNRLYNLKKNIGNKFEYVLIDAIKPLENEINTYFDWKFYINYNKDLINIKTYEQAIEHYNLIGKNEFRLINNQTEILIQNKYNYRSLPLKDYYRGYRFPLISASIFNSVTFPLKSVFFS